VDEALAEPVMINENGRRKKATKLQVIVKQLVNKAAQGDHRGAAPEKGVEDELAARGAIQNGIGYQPHGLDSRMQREQVTFLTGAAGARVVPNVSAIAPVLAEKYIVAVRRAAVLQDKNELVTAAV
jgi:hypothetical protein